MMTMVSKKDAITMYRKFSSDLRYRIMLQENTPIQDETILMLEMSIEIIIKAYYAEVDGEMLNSSPGFVMKSIIESLNSLKTRQASLFRDQTLLALINETTELIDREDLKAVVMSKIKTTEMTLAELYKGVDFGQTPDPIKHNDYMNGITAVCMNSIQKRAMKN